MKKSVKMISMALIILTILCSITTIVLGAKDLSQSIKDLGNTEAQGTASVMNVGGMVVAIVQTVGIVVAVVVLLVLGIKYMMGSAEEKAEYKKTMIPYIVGAVLIFAATTIVNVVYNMANGLNSVS